MCQANGQLPESSVQGNQPNFFTGFNRLVINFEHLGEAVSDIYRAIQNSMGPKLFLTLPAMLNQKYWEKLHFNLCRLRV